MTVMYYVLSESLHVQESHTVAPEEEKTEQVTNLCSLILALSV